MLVGVQALGEDVITRQNHNNREVLVHQRQHAVLELARHDGLAMEVTNLLDLEGALEGGAELRPTSQQQQRLLVLENLAAEVLDGGVLCEDLANLLADLAQALHDLETPLVLASTVLAKAEGEHDHGDELRRVGLGRGDTNLGTSVDVHTTMRQQGDGATHDIHNTDGQGAALQAVTQGHEGVGRLTRLGDKDARVVTEDRGLAIEEIGGQFHGDGDLGQLLKHTTDCHTAVVRSSAGNEDDAAAATDGADVGAQATEGDGLIVDVQAATHGVDDGLGLLKNLLLHEVVELALHDLLQLQLEGLNAAHIAAAVALLETVDVEGALVDVGNVIVLQVHDLLGVLDNGGRVGGEEELGGHGHAIVGHEGAGLGAVEEGLVGGAEQGGDEKAVGALGGLLEGDVLGGGLSRQSTAVLVGVLDIDEVDLHALLGLDADDERRTLASGDDLVGKVDRFDEQAVGALELGDDGLGQVDKVEVGVLVVEVLCELGNALSVGLGLKFVALGAQEGLKLLVVGDDSVVDDGKLPGRVRSVWRP